MLNIITVSYHKIKGFFQVKPEEGFMVLDLEPRATAADRLWQHLNLFKVVRLDIDQQHTRLINIKTMAPIFRPLLRKNRVPGRRSASCVSKV